jgi:hypothetical protein
MGPNDVIAAFIDDTVCLLPAALRKDVAIELHALLHEELEARAEQTGGQADAALALDLVRGYGRPEEVAARYTQPSSIIDPSDSKRFLRAAIIGAVVLALLAAMRERMGPPISTDGVAAAGNPSEDVGTMLQIGILAWLGVLVTTFGVRSWIRRRWPESRRWRPRDRDRVNRIGTAIVVPLASACVLLYAAPTWVLDQLFRGRLDTSWSAYTPEFQRFQLPWFIGLLAGSLVLLAIAAIRGRWSRFMRRLSVAMNIALSLIVLKFAVDGGLFLSPDVDAIARNVCAAVTLFYLPLMGACLYAELGRVDCRSTCWPERPEAATCASKQTA